MKPCQGLHEDLSALQVECMQYEGVRASASAILLYVKLMNKYEQIVLYLCHQLSMQNPLVEDPPNLPYLLQAAPLPRGMPVEFSTPRLYSETRQSQRAASTGGSRFWGQESTGGAWKAPPTACRLQDSA